MDTQAQEEAQTHERGGGGAFALGAMLGAALGAILGLLYAPRPGAETRRELARTSERLYQQAREAAPEPAAAPDERAASRPVGRREADDGGARASGVTERYGRADASDDG